jgi:hypothetical protein
MKAKLLFLVPVAFIISFFACNKRAPLGQWADNIQLSGKEFSFSAGGDSVLITAKGKWFGINCVTLDTNKINVYSSMTDACNFIYVDNNIRIESKDCNTLFIKMNANNTYSDRTLSIGLSAGDYFDGIKIVQKKK